MRKLKFFIIPFLFVVLLVSDVYFECKFPKLVTETIYTEKLHNGQQISVVQISDPHSKEFGEGNIRLNRLIEKAAPDIIICTGDVVDIDPAENVFSYSYRFFDLLLQFGKPVFYVSGNHEAWDDWKALSEQAQNQGIFVLDNKNKKITVNEIPINICGIDDYNTKFYNIEEATDGINDNFYTILASHTPAVIKEMDSEAVDLILSGHTHGGQVRLPVLQEQLINEKDILKKYRKGFYRENEILLYVDSGLGTTRLPFRFLNRSQITLIEIKGR